MLIEILSKDIWRTHELICLCAFTVYFAYTIKANILVRITLCYFLLSAVISFNGYTSWGDIQPRLDATSAIEFARLALIAYVVSSLTVEKTLVLVYILQNLIIVNCGVVLFYGYGFFGAHSFDTTIAAIALPSIMARQYGIWPSLLIVATIAIKGGSTAYFSLAAAAIGYCFIKRYWLMLLTPIGPLIAAYYYLGSELLDSKLRVQEWKIFYRWWIDSANWLVGTGTGTFVWLGPLAQMQEQAKHNPTYYRGLMPWMHNDYFQVLFEQGIIGLILCLSIFVLAFLRARRDAFMFSFLCALSVSMMTYYPLRFSASLLFILCLFRLRTISSS